MNSKPSDGQLDRLTTLRAAVEAALDSYSQPLAGSPERLTAAIRYSLLAPGKRLRPLLVLLAAEAVGGDWHQAIPAACAVEMVHAYSLIHDDLPAMDNDDLRRGQPTCHRKFDEATAILAGDALQAMAFETLAAGCHPSHAAACCLELARTAGRAWLVGGQQDDLAAEGRFGFCPYGQSPAEQLAFLQRIHERKTGAMITSSLKLGGLAVGAAPELLEALEEFGLKIGLAFQIVDDLLDVESSVETMGKHTGKDAALGKLTYPRLLGIEKSHQWAGQLVTEACNALAPLGEPAAALVTMARFVLERNN
ncbi:MAG: polyprenyl synthetase family protein [Pirellulaceae bacterium]|nr:polyprenyl synthetase family protein [Pirellulaceae bacterium]